MQGRHIAVAGTTCRHRLAMEMMMDPANRLRRKLEVMLEDFKKANNLRKHDVEEMLSLLDLIEKGTTSGREKTLQSQAHSEHG